MRKFLRDLRDLMLETARYWHPDAVAGRMNRWVMRQHRPERVGCQEVLCVHCTRRNKPVPWPCDEWVKAEQRLTGGAA
jgi:hypothetical protein